jgi:pimeloyl-ACP methyl ester carboxylesterase
MAIYRTLFDFDPAPALRSYHGPSLVVTTPRLESPGSIDKVVPGIRSREIAGTSHWMQMDCPDEFNRILDEFVETTSDGPRPRGALS